MRQSVDKECVRNKALLYAKHLHIDPDDPKDSTTFSLLQQVVALKKRVKELEIYSNIPSNFPTSELYEVNLIRHLGSDECFGS